MADIFLSYASVDRERIRPLVGALEQQGWSVWWDRKIPPGKTYDQVIKRNIPTVTLELRNAEFIEGEQENLSATYAAFLRIASH